MKSTTLIIPFLSALALAGCESSESSIQAGPGSDLESSEAADDERMSEEARRELERRGARISRGANRSDAPEWAGSYYEGDGLGKNVALSLAPDEGFTFTWNGCLGLYDLNYGDVRVDQGRIHLTSVFENDQKGFGGFDPVLTPVAWGERMYLIPPGDLIDFVNDVNAGWEPRDGVHGSFLLRRGDEERPVEGLPALPPELLGALLEEPIRAAVVSVSEEEDPKPDDRYRGIVEIVLDRGAEDGVVEGHRFFLIEKGVFESCKVDRVEARRCFLRTRHFELTHSLPSVGSLAVTRR